MLAFSNIYVIKSSLYMVNEFETEFSLEEIPKKEAEAYAILLPASTPYLRE